MGEEEKYGVNDTTRKIDGVISDLKSFDSPLIDGGTRSHLISRLVEARMLSLLLIKDSEDAPSRFRSKAPDQPAEEE
jgi:hypothetical protein